MRLLLPLLVACSPAAVPQPPTPSAPAPPEAVAEADPSPPAPTTPPPAPPPRSDSLDRARVRELTQAERDAMTGVSWRPDCPVGLEELRVLELPHHTPDGGVARGELIVHADAAEAVTTAFMRLHELGFPVTRMRPVRHYDGDDGRSMAADNTSAFNCRPIANGSSWSEHAYGRALDLNPLRNPYVRGDRVDPPEGRAWLERDAERPGVLVSGSPAVQAFAEVGWRWGGHWRSLKDYQHFSASGR